MNEECREKRARMEAEAARILRDIPRIFETGEEGVLSLPSHEPGGFERARGVLRTCVVVGHAPDCECATL